jgi:metal-sulfur cluster biosynthetic enzyme
MCPFADDIISQVETEVNTLNFGEAQVELDFDEPWEPSEELKLELGI